MTCDEFWKAEPDGLGHLEECAACTERFERQSRMASALRRLGAQTRSREAPARVERALVAGFRAQAYLPAARPTGMWWAVGAWAAALAVTVGLALLLVHGRQPEQTERNRQQKTQFAMAEPSGSVWEVDAAGEFIPLPNAERIAHDEPVNLVRVELPRSSMIALGFAVSEEQADEAVEADVMLGADGVARAVRFLE